jgi:hypothetical protein
VENGEIQEKYGNCIDGKAWSVAQKVYVLRCDNSKKEEDEVAGKEMNGE